MIARKVIFRSLAASEISPFDFCRAPISAQLGPIHTKDARFFCCGNSAADLSKLHTFKWDPLADDVLEAA